MRPLSFKRKLLFSFVTLLFILALAELSLRLFDMARGASVQARGIFIWGYEQDRFLDFRAKPNIDLTFSGGSKFDTNSQGFRDVETLIEPQQQRRLIICIGESSTWGTGASDHNHTYPRFLQEELNRASPEEPFIVMNAGIPGYTTVHNLQLLQLRLLKYKPEAIVYMGAWNDSYQYVADLGSASDFNCYPRGLFVPDTWVNRTLMRSSLFTFVFTRWWLIREGHPTERARQQRPQWAATPRGESLFRDQIALMKLLCQRHAVKLIWVDQVLNRSKATDNQVKLFENLRTILHDELRRQDIPLLQAEDRYDHAADPMLDEVHFTDAGNAQLAKILAPQLLVLLQGSTLPRPAGNGIHSGNESQRRP